MKKLGLYFHIPFCNSKCSYCDFYSSVSTYSKRKLYIQSLLKEIDLAKKIYNLDEYVIDTVFIGGGTPTALDEDLLDILLQKIESSFSFTKDCEYSIEINPNSISEEKIKVIKKSKINRISIGLQSTQKDELKILGRTHSYDEFLDTYNRLRHYGYENINIDLIMGVPNQTIDTYKKNLQNIVKLEPQHISAYMLIIEENTPLYNMYEKGIIQIDDDLVLRMYDETIDYLVKNGYEQYEISNFAKKNHKSDENKNYRCKHNIRYWNVDEYLGFGSNAHSYFESNRFSNESDKYLDILEKNMLPISQINNQTQKDLYEEWIFLKLRMIDGIVIDEIDSKFNIDFRKKYKTKLKDLYEKKLIKEYSENLSLTTEGIKISNSIFVDFM